MKENIKNPKIWFLKVGKSTCLELKLKKIRAFKKTLNYKDPVRFLKQNNAVLEQV